MSRKIATAVEDDDDEDEDEDEESDEFSDNENSEEIVDEENKDFGLKSLLEEDDGKKSQVSQTICSLSLLFPTPNDVHDNHFF